MVQLDCLKIWIGYKKRNCENKTPLMPREHLLPSNLCSFSRMLALYLLREDYFNTWFTLSSGLGCILCCSPLSQFHLSYKPFPIIFPLTHYLNSGPTWMLGLFIPGGVRTYIEFVHPHVIIAYVKADIVYKLNRSSRYPIWDEYKFK